MPYHRFAHSISSSSYSMPGGATRNLARYLFSLYALLCLAGMISLTGCSSKSEDKVATGAGASSVSGQPAGPAPKSGNNPDQIIKEAKEGKND